jgi:hypothetical protein
MRFEPYHHLAGRPNVVLDGSPTEGTVLTVTHWPGYPPPEAIADDLSAQMAFRLLDHPELVPDGVELVSNNHFDQDGLVSLFALCRPEDARARQPFLEDVARAGDFAVYADRDAARVSMALSTMAGDDARPDDYLERTGGLYEELLGRLPELCDAIQGHPDLWAEEDASLTASEAALASGAVQLEEIPDVELAVVTVPDGAPDAGGHRFGGDWASGLHPMAVCSATERLVLATVRDGRYEVEHRYESWVQLRSRPLRQRRDLIPLAERLQEEETAATTWSATDIGGLIPRLTTAGEPSSVAPDRFVEVLVDHLRTAPPGWDPFTPDP